MKTKRAGLPTLLLMIAVIAGLEARATKDNVGTRLPELHLQFSGEAPECAGRPLLIEFWATSCSSCRESVSHLNALYGKFKPRGLQALGVTEDDDVTVKAFVKDFPISYPVGHDRHGRLANTMGIEALPHALLVDKSGRIVWEGHPLNITESQLEGLMK
jgi:peroxiredoxin